MITTSQKFNSQKSKLNLAIRRGSKLSVKTTPKYLPLGELDTYGSKLKPVEFTLCRDCKAVFYKGRWTWMKPSTISSPETTCPACRRIKDRCPSGELTISGASIALRKAEMVSLIHHQETNENKRHPLHRIISVTMVKGCLVVKTTDIHLPHRIGAALHKAYKGKLKHDYDVKGSFARVHLKLSE